MDRNVFNRHHTQSDTEAKTREEALHVIAYATYEAGYVKDKNAYSEDMCECEKEATTGFQDGIVIPHSKHATCIKPGIFLVKFEHPIAWSALGGESAQMALGPTISEDGGDVYLCILSKLARKIISKEFRTVLKTGTDTDALYKTTAVTES